MNLIIGGTLQSAVFGLVVAGLIGAKVARERYQKRHVAAGFESKFFAMVSCNLVFNPLTAHGEFAQKKNL